MTFHLMAPAAPAKDDSKNYRLTLMEVAVAANKIPA
jgi:hypothetical protein